MYLIPGKEGEREEAVTPGSWNRKVRAWGPNRYVVLTGCSTRILVQGTDTSVALCLGIVGCCSETEHIPVVNSYVSARTPCGGVITRSLNGLDMYVCSNCVSYVSAATTYCRAITSLL